LIGSKVDHDPQAVLLGGIEQRTGRRVIDANGVDAIRRHQREITLDSLFIVVLVSASVRTEGSIGYATDV
jgi:hypothetical protein